jgi:hypothetical protein
VIILGILGLVERNFYIDGNNQSKATNKNAVLMIGRREAGEMN